MHLLVVGEPDFLPGSGDGAQKWLHSSSELSVEEALNSVKSKSFTAAAHPFTPVGFLERLLINRGKWEEPDLDHQRLDGWQIFNGAGGTGWKRDLGIWTTSLREGKRSYIYAGNDAHGNFNRFRQVGFPMLKLKEHHHHLFGRQTTRAMVEGAFTVPNLLKALKTGRASVSEGPIIELTVHQNGRKLHTGGEASPSEEGRIVVGYATAAEFGSINRVRILTSDNNGEVAMQVRSSPGSFPATLTGSGNGTNGLVVTGDLGGSDASTIWTWANNPGFPYVVSGLIVPSSKTLQVAEGTVVKFWAANSEINVYGAVG